MAESHYRAPNKFVHGSNGIDYAYRGVGEGQIPLVHPLAKAEEVLEEVRRDLVEAMPYSVAQKMADILWPPEHHYYWKSSFSQGPER